MKTRLKSDVFYMVYDTYKYLGFDEDECYLRAEKYSGLAEGVK